MTPGPRADPTSTAARRYSLPVKKLGLRAREQGRWRGRLLGTTQVKAASLLVTAPHAHLDQVPETACFRLSCGGRGAAQSLE